MSWGGPANSLGSAVRLRNDLYGERIIESKPAETDIDSCIC